jgi:hypothetical protein
MAISRTTLSFDVNYDDNDGDDDDNNNNNYGLLHYPYTFYHFMWKLLTTNWKIRTVVMLLPLKISDRNMQELVGVFHEFHA